MSQMGGLPLHLHVEGLRGTGKTSIIRSARSIFPTITRIKGCLYNCDPENPHCPEHYGLSPEIIGELGTEEVPMPFLEISASAKVGTVVGTIDLGKITSSVSPVAALLPGTIAQANRGIVFIDEINRLADTSPELADVLLDVMGTKPGRLQIEESGLPPVRLPVQVAVWAASNPDEDPGPLEDIRRQLSDRFDYLLEINRPDQKDVVLQVLDSRNLGGEKNIILFGEEDKVLSQNLAALSSMLKEIQLDREVGKILATIYTKFDLESLRGVEAMQYGCKVYAARLGKKRVEVEDLLAVAAGALRHRVDPRQLTEVLNYLQQISSTGSGSNVAAGLNTERGTETSFDLPVRDEHKMNGLQKFIDNIRSRLAKLNSGLAGNRVKAGSQSGRGKGSSNAANRNYPALGGNSTSSQPIVSDPTKMSILSPPHRAKPICELAAEDIINAGEKE